MNEIGGTAAAEALMYRAILVPLDGSPFAEQAIAVALTIGEACHASVTLIRAWDPANYRYTSELTPPFLDPGTHDRAAAEVYLDAIAARVRTATTVPIEVAVIAGSAPDAIRERLTQRGDELVVMTTHGLTGWSRAWIGSVADAVVRTVTVPVLLVRPLDAGGPAAPGRFERVLVPLDGSPEAEEILTHAAAIAGNARFVLLRVERAVTTPLHPYAYVAPARETDEEATEQTVVHARDYLSGVAQTLEARLPAATVDIDARLADRPGKAIVEAAEEYGADLVALTTHARRAVRLFLGSVADKVLRGAHGSVLVLRPSVVATGDEPGHASAGAASSHR